VLFIHDVHALIGEREFDFEDAVRDGYVSAVADDDTRFLLYGSSTHGSGDAYIIVTVTAVRDGAAFDRLVQRLRYGDLADWATKVEAMRYGLTSTLLVATDWSPLSLELEAIPTEPSEQPVTLLREDTLEGPGVDGALSSPSLQAGDDDVLTCIAGFSPALAPGGMVRVLYRVADPDRFTPVFGADTGWQDWAGSLTPTLPDDVQRSSRFLRTPPWGVMQSWA
jgi:hypothetical protein